MREDSHHPTPFSPWSTHYYGIYISLLFQWIFCGDKPFRSPVGRKGIVSRDEYYFWRLIIKIGTFCTCADPFLQIFVSYLMKKSNSKFYLAPLKLQYFHYFVNPSSNPLQRPSSGDFDTENAYRKPWFCEIIQEAACDKLILAHFPCSQWEVSTVHQSEEAFRKHFQNCK